MSISYDTFERLKDRGLAAYKAGDFVADKPFLMQAADTMILFAVGTIGYVKQLRSGRMNQRVHYP